ncbi:hypothetical protein HSBAA_36420 [Vreelandella sulfidaeris]|uniref:Uncharacterized protein n=1 Tax=Vreelandella sulfidaeris TaxID=115553 RepID=A0A455U874_9GAMM|nr:hypothetical protein HSBAA_36420 [Halomonas sulfidaeris]
MSLLMAGFAMHRHKMFWPNPLIKLNELVLSGMSGGVQLRVIELVIDTDT